MSKLIKVIGLLIITLVFSGCELNPIRKAKAYVFASRECGDIDEVYQISNSSIFVYVQCKNGNYSSIFLGQLDKIQGEDVKQALYKSIERGN